MTKPPETDEERQAYDAIYETWFYPLGMKPKSIKGLKARRRMYDKVTAVSRRISAIYFTIWDELQRQGIGGDQPWYVRGDVVRKAADARIAAWSDAQDGIDALAPRTPLEDLLDEHYRLQQTEYDLLDDIEKREGAVSPLFDSRPYSTPRPCPYPTPELVRDKKQEIPND